MYRVDVRKGTESKNDTQICSKYAHSKKTGGKESGSTCRVGDDNCEQVVCPSHCQYPFSDRHYKGDAANEKYYGEINKFSSQREVDYNKVIKEGLLDEYATHASNKNNISNDLSGKYSRRVRQPCKKKSCKGRAPIFRCMGRLTGPMRDEDGKVIPLTFPSPPTKKEVIESILNSSNFDINITNTGVDWGKVKKTNELENIRKRNNWTIEGNGLVIDEDKRIPIADNGIQLEWWTTKGKKYSDDQLLSIIPKNIRQYVNLNDIHAKTGGVLERTFRNHARNNMTDQQVYDWLKKRRLEREKVEGSGGGGGVSEKHPLFDFYNVEANTLLIREQFEGCIDILMQTEHDDEVHLKKIKGMEHFSDLGDPKNRDELLYVEAKILKFIILDKGSFGKCMDIIYITDKICKRGLSTNIMRMMGKFINMETKDMENKEYKENKKKNRESSTKITAAFFFLPSMKSQTNGGMEPSARRVFNLKLTATSRKA